MTLYDPRAPSPPPQPIAVQMSINDIIAIRIGLDAITNRSDNLALAITNLDAVILHFTQSFTITPKGLNS